MAQRDPIPGHIDRALRKRDGNKCRKCGRQSHIERHHIIAVMDGGANDLDNLLLLCWPCHREWEVIETVGMMTFDEWLPLPNMLLLLDIFANARWSRDTNMDDARYFIIMRDKQYRQEGWKEK
jgi:hypothetical protein